MSLFPNPQTGYTYDGSKYDQLTGIWNKGTKEEFSFEGTIQPMSGKEIESLMGAREDRGMVKIYSNYEFKTSEEGVEQQPDVVVFSGLEYEVVKRLEHSSNIINHVKYVAALREASS